MSLKPAQSEHGSAFSGYTFLPYGYHYLTKYLQQIQTDKVTQISEHTSPWNATLFERCPLSEEHKPPQCSGMQQESCWRPAGYKGLLRKPRSRSWRGRRVLPGRSLPKITVIPHRRRKPPRTVMTRWSECSAGQTRLFGFQHWLMEECMTLPCVTSLGWAISSCV